MYQIKHTLLCLVCRPLHRNQFDASLVPVQAVLSLPVIVSLRLVHDQHHSIVDARKIALVEPWRIELKFGLADVCFVETDASLVRLPRGHVGLSVSPVVPVSHESFETVGV